MLLWMVSGFLRVCPKNAVRRTLPPDDVSDDAEGSCVPNALDGGIEKWRHLHVIGKVYIEPEPAIDRVRVRREPDNFNACPALRQTGGAPRPAEMLHRVVDICPAKRNPGSRIVSRCGVANSAPVLSACRSE